MLTMLMHAGVTGHLHPSDFALFTAFAVVGAVSIVAQIRKWW